MCGLGVNEELVDRSHVDVLDQAEVDAHANFRKVMKRLFTADFLGGA